ncbi:hypothetical protein CVT26_005292 [Gymnopilus dilepis]|uniref:Uncharacterized protein n=1 Tax=Gymnopilus dilepis TaxID=231916 RepID=A0A409YST3_9AGAR|nr:hypothetical protein CVT26_005292 [Gymnopilus dilepis]
MQFTVVSFFTVVSLLVGVLSAPLELVRRGGPDLSISLRETGKNTADWHFALVVHPTGASFTGKHVPVHEYSLWHGCLVYDDTRSAPTADRQLVQNAKIIPAKGEATDADLETAVKAILKTDVKSADPLIDPNYKNCFDYTLEAVQDLERNGYVSAAEYGKFKTYYDHPEGGKPYHQVVRDRTYPALKAKLTPPATKP